jgi:DNA-binding NarL/FixJ family response regulator
MISVLVVDDHHLVRAGLIGLLDSVSDIDVVGEAPDGGPALEAIRRRQPDVVLMDISMPGLDGIRTTRALITEYPDLKVVALTSFADQTRVREMLSAGAVGYLLKDCEPDQLIGAIRAAASGQVPLDPRVAAAVLPDRARPSDGLSKREIEVLQLAAKGMANKQIGRALGISERTVKVHLGNVFRCIGVSDRTSAALWAHEHLPSRATGSLG